MDDEKQVQWHLGNGEDLHAKNPDTFELPPESRRKALRPGEFAKLIFRSEKGGERMWVEVKTISADGYIGTLANEPSTIEGLELDDPVTFKAEHIIDVHVEGGPVTWNLLFAVGDGHRYFEDSNGSVAVADDSGDTPDQTDDGVLWVNRHAPIVGGKDGFLIPLRTLDGVSTHTPAGVVEALEVASRLDLPIQTDSGSYVVRRG